MISGNSYVTFTECIVLPANYSVNLVDSWGDGWNGNTLTVDGVTYTLDGINYNGSYASFQVGACIVLGCTDSLYIEYDASANTDDGSCVTIIVYGCTDSTAYSGYNPLANTDDGSCTVDPLSIGETYEGGIIFYHFQPGEAGYVAGEVHGLIAAPTDQSYGAGWGCQGITMSGADGTAIGTGNQNTIDIEAGCTTTGTAADICANYTDGTYSDWFLPSKDELNLMYVNLYQQGLGGFAYDTYWSSTELEVNNSWLQGFYNGNQNTSNKNYTFIVRAVRAF